MLDRARPVGLWVEALSLEDLERRFLFRLLFPRHLLETGTCDFSSSARYLFPDRGSRARVASQEGTGKQKEKAKDVLQPIRPQKVIQRSMFGLAASLIFSTKVLSPLCQECLKILV